MIINFFLNGDHYKITNKLTIQEILSYFNYTDTIFIVEYNNLICNQNCWKLQKIKNNDRIEIISIVGGG